MRSRVEVREAERGYVVSAPWPHGRDPSGLGEVVCRDFGEVVDLLRQVFRPAKAASGEWWFDDAGRRTP